MASGDASIFDTMALRFSEAAGADRPVSGAMAVPVGTAKVVVGAAVLVVELVVGASVVDEGLSVSLLCDVVGGLLLLGEVAVASSSAPDETSWANGNSVPRTTTASSAAATQQRSGERKDDLLLFPPRAAPTAS